jgi:L-lactate dehydrogenase
MQSGVLGISDVSISLPTKLGRQGIIQVVEPAISFEEHEALLTSAAGLREVLGHVAAATAR